MKYFLLISTIFLGAFKTIFTKTSKKKNATLPDALKTNLISFSCAFITLLLFGLGGFKENFSVPYILALCYAVCTLASQLCLMKAVELGSVSISSLFYSCGFIIPTLWGNIYYDEGINLPHILGFLLIISSFFLSTTKSEKVKFNWKWLLAALGGTLFSGLVGVIQKLFTNNYSQYSLDYFLYTAFVFILLINGALLVFLSIIQHKNFFKKEKESSANASTKKIILFTILLGVCIGLANKVNTYLSGVFPSIISFPVINGGAILTTSLFSWLIFKEKLTLKQWIGIFIGLTGIILLAVGQTI